MVCGFQKPGMYIYIQIHTITWQRKLTLLSHVCVGEKTERNKNIVVYMNMTKNGGSKCFLTLKNLPTAISQSHRIL